ncbi:Zinc finger, C2H2 type family protein [Brugia malayi]|uniref:Bm3927 n=1 Tax=Brugia malayi TaxID=6279 RepID=A0A1P6BIL7_BRUMA|nr:Zinc finger, C2H2 type family protein [Brugia malayi]CRZ23589.1 Bm3927 [Brugia malayi]VIO97679.1 Zinc finger, C2H2 type family protein [Brugia malayi]
MEQFEPIILQPVDVPVATGSGEPMAWITRLQDKEFYFKCLWSSCFMVYDTLNDLLQHIRSHIEQLTVQNQNDGSIIVCPISGCSKILATEHHLYRHLYMHNYHIRRQWTGLNVIFSRDDVANIPHCGFRTSMELIYDGSAMACGWVNCSTLWDDIDLYCNHVDDHVDSLDVMDRDQRCQLNCGWQGCKMHFKNKANLRVHCRHHSGDKTAACPYCGVFFANNSKLIDHMLRKNQIGPEMLENGELRTIYSCHLCQKQFGTQRLLREHCRRHVMNHKCKYCTVTVDSPSALKRHVAAVHAKCRLYTCCYCGHSFSQKADVDRHMVVHSNELTHKCGHCGEQFRWKKQLTAHIRKHDKVYIPYTHLCHLCDAKYANGFGLSRHLMRKHKCSIPRGFTRFQYKKCKDGYARLQTKRCLSRSLAIDLGCCVNETKEKA